MPAQKGGVHALSMATAGCALVQVLVRMRGGAGGRVLRFVTLAGATRLRAAHPRLAAAVAAETWGWARAAGLRVRRGEHAAADAAAAAARFAASFPLATCGVRVVMYRAPRRHVCSSAAADTDADAGAHTDRNVLTALPPCIRVIGLSGAPRRVRRALTAASLAHFTALQQLDVSGSGVCDAVPGAVPGARTGAGALDLVAAHLSPELVFAAMRALRVLDVSFTTAADALLAALPPSLRELHAVATRLGAGARFSHLPRLRVLHVDCTAVGNDALASAPPRLRRLTVASTALTPAASFVHLPRLTGLAANGTRVSNAAVASLPPCMRHLCLDGTDVTDGAFFDHLPALRKLTLARTSVGAATVSTLPRTLWWLSLQRTRIDSDTSLLHLAALRGLDVRNIASATAAAVVASLPPLPHQLTVHSSVYLGARALAHLPRLRLLLYFDKWV